jgi:hypothetical protein
MSVRMIGTEGARPSISRSMTSGSSKPPLSTIPAIDGKVADELASSTAISTSARSLGMTTTDPSIRRGSTFAIDIAATTTPSASRVSSSGSPETRVPSMACMMLRMLGATRYGSSGMIQTGTSVAPVGSRAGSTATERTAATSSSLWAGSARFTIMASSDTCSSRSSARATSVSWRMSSGVRGSLWPSRSPLANCSPWLGPTRPPSTSSTGAPRFAAMRALKASSVGLPTSV